jgi:hypothetical protein
MVKKGVNRRNKSLCVKNLIIYEIQNLNIINIFSKRIKNRMIVNVNKDNYLNLHFFKEIIFEFDFGYAFGKLIDISSNKNKTYSEFKTKKELAKIKRPCFLFKFTILTWKNFL